jgi:hypothetical protein
MAEHFPGRPSLYNFLINNRFINLCRQCRGIIPEQRQTLIWQPHLIPGETQMALDFA